MIKWFRYCLFNKLILFISPTFSFVMYMKPFVLAPCHLSKHKTVFVACSAIRIRCQWSLLHNYYWQSIANDTAITPGIHEACLPSAMLVGGWCSIEDDDTFLSQTQSRLWYSSVVYTVKNFRTLYNVVAEMDVSFCFECGWIPVQDIVLISKEMFGLSVCRICSSSP
jgi:hypothetical protein